jgi:serine/threonine protein phosphatase 1
MIKVFNINKNGKDFVVGDIHGRFDELMKTLGEVGLNFSKDRLFSVGDLIDRGVQYREVIQLLSEPWFFSLRMLERLYKK